MKGKGIASSVSGENGRIRRTTAFGGNRFPATLACFPKNNRSLPLDEGRVKGAGECAHYG